MVRLISVRSRRSARRGVLLGGSGPTPFRGHAALTKAAPPISNPDVSTIFTSACAAITGLAGTYPSPPPKRPGQVGGDGTRGHESLLQVGFSPDGPVNAHPWMSTNFTRLLANRHPDLGDSLRRCKPLFKYGYCKNSPARGMAYACRSVGKPSPSTSGSGQHDWFGRFRRRSICAFWGGVMNEFW